MSPKENKHNDENEPHSSGYEGDVTEGTSRSNAVETESSSYRDSCIDLSNEDDNTEYGTIWIGCDARDAGPGVESDADSPFGTIWIGCNLRELGLEDRETVQNTNDEPTAEHVEDIDRGRDSNDGNGGSDRK
ncbi:hypothetical protein BJY04DRAFT_217111 [Aspergillus karnatakaensis]|uniref:uncharacterized protein n=1 Tax=Aspergillus karnatakaensis TaxID=1810916 RepID=UPI003CCD6C7F